MRYSLLRAVARPAWVALALAVLACAPAMALLARAATVVTGRPEPVAVARLLLVYVTGELSLLMSPARSREHRLRQLSGFLDDVVRTAAASLRLKVILDAEPAAADALERHERALLVFSRHAGPGDSVLLVHLLLSRFGRRPGIVMKEILTVDPVVGLVAEHLPSALIDGAIDDPDEVEALARGIGSDAALLLFPEGGNFSEERRTGAIGWLRGNGHGDRASRAESLRHMVAPRPRGVGAALHGAPDADVLFVAHTGLGRAASGLRVLRALPRDTSVRIRMWHVPAAEVPPDEAGRAKWLDDWWARLDAWVDEQGLE